MKTLVALILFWSSLLIAPASALSLAILDPYLVRPGNLANLDLKSFLQGNPNLSNYSAKAMVGDGVSSGILLIETNVNSPVTVSDETGFLGLRRYSDNFLTKPVGRVKSSITFSKLWYINGNYYAAALTGVLSVAGGLNYDAFSVSQQNQGSAEGTMFIDLPPVILVHGLWGNKQSLSAIQEYLIDTGQGEWGWYNWATNPTAICYSLYLKFDAKDDPLSDGKDPCEYTSEHALKGAINSTLRAMDSSQIVAGRVDVVAHSMGGLVLRNYAYSTDYASPRNGMLGQLHSIITLDTPEQGSELANFLIEHRDGTRKASLLTQPGIGWSVLCGSRDTEDCFTKMKYPLYAPTLPVKTGAVYSLEPEYVASANISPPAITNASWLDVAATAPPSNGALGAGLDMLIAALYKNPNTAPTVDSILQDFSNDAIVTTTSQTGGAQSNQILTETNLSHAPLDKRALNELDVLYGSDFDNDSVLASDDVEDGLTCWLVSQEQSCNFRETPKRLKVSAVQGEQELSPRVLSAQIAVRSKNSAQLGAPLDIAVKIPPSVAISELSISQRGEMGEETAENKKQPISEGDVVHMKIIPRALGPVELSAAMRFNDGSIAFATTKIFIKPPLTPPLVFKAGDLPYFVLDLDDETKVGQPAPFAVYPSPVGKIWLNYRFVTYRLVPQAGTPVIDILPNGLIHALAPGEADVEARFGSFTDRIHVVVRATQQ